MAWIDLDELDPGEVVPHDHYNGLVTNQQLIRRVGGLVAAVASSTSTASLSAGVATDLAGLSITFTAEAARTYEIRAHVNFNLALSTYHVLTEIKRGSTAIRSSKSDPEQSSDTQVDLSIVDAPGAGSVTYKITCTATGGGTLAGTANKPHQLWIVDLGPTP